MESIAVWNIILTGAFGVFTFVAKSWYHELQRTSILLNKTREEIAKEYVTKTEAHNDFNRVIARIDALDHKIDRLIESQTWDGQERRSRG